MKKVAIIGLGSIGKTVALNLTLNGQAVIVASRNLDAASLFSHLPAADNLMVAKEITDAISEAEIIIPAIWFTSYKDFFAEYAPLLKGKIVIDVSNPIIPNEKGELQRLIAADQSAGEINASFLPKGVKLVKALGSLSAFSLKNKANTDPKTTLFYATDDIEVKADIEVLIKSIGFRPEYIGGMDQAIRMEVGGNLHEINSF